MLKLKEKERTQIINALRAGVVPTIGLRHIQVGRVQELNEIVKNLDLINDGGSTVRFVSGEFGAGKSFFLTLAKLIAHEKRLVVVNADITPDKILCASDGKTRALITELFKNLSYKSKPDGGALKSIVETWISKFKESNPNPTENSFYQALSSLSHLALCQDFSKVLFRYLQAFEANDLPTIEKCLKWMRAEYETKREARNDLEVNRIIEDADFFDVLKLFSGFVKLGGFGGLLVLIDEIAVLVRLRAPQRHKNYEMLLAIINDCLSGSAQNIGFVFGATSDSIENREKGLYSYGALETRLAQTTFHNQTIKDLTGTVIPLSTLTREELYVLLSKLREIYANGDPSKILLPDEGLKGFFEQVYSVMGADSHLNPRDVIKGFLGTLATLDGHPNVKWTDLISKVRVEVSKDTDEDLVRIQGD